MTNDISKTELKKLNEKYDEFMKKLKELEGKLIQNPPDDKHLEVEIEQLKKRMDEILIRIDELKERSKPKEPEESKDKEVKEPGKKDEPGEDKSIFM